MLFRSCGAIQVGVVENDQGRLAAQFHGHVFDADQRLLTLPGTTLLVFTSTGCSSCRTARKMLPEMQLPIDQLCWIDAGDNGGLVERYEIFHLPALFVVRDGAFYGEFRRGFEGCR